MLKKLVVFFTLVMVLATLSPAFPAAVKNSAGRTLPPDAAPLEYQVLRIMSQPATTLDWFISVYKRTNEANNYFGEPLVRLNKNFEIVPAAAKSWRVSKDGLTWTFTLDKNIHWSDGTPLTAEDFVFSFQLGADPKHGWDFGWFYSPIKNWDKAVRGEVPPTEIGIKQGSDPYTLIITTEYPAPYLPMMMLYSTPLSKKAYQKYGPYYNNDPKTSVSCGPYILEEWTKDKQIVFRINKNYGGRVKPYLEKIIVTFGDPGTSAFKAYLAGEIDICGYSNSQIFTPADLEVIEKDPELSKQFHQGFGDFRTFYLGFDCYNPPFNNLKVRQAFAYAIDKESIVNTIIKKQGITAYGFLMPGFPGANPEGLKKIYTYNPELAKKLLAEAGYPDGKGFPALDMWVRSDLASPTVVAAANAIGAMIKKNLGIDVKITVKETKTFMDALNAHKLQFYLVSYGMDYLDQSNMLGIWVSTGRHAWKNDRFDKLVKDASALIDKKKRDEMFKEAEKILVEDVGGIFLWHQTPGALWKPYVKGKSLEPDKFGITALHWPGIEGVGTTIFDLYISKDVLKYRK